MKKTALFFIAIFLFISAFAAENPKHILLTTQYENGVAALDDIAGRILPEAGIFPEHINQRYFLIKTDQVPLNKLTGYAVYIIRIFRDVNNVVYVDVSGSYVVVGYNEKTPYQMDLNEWAQKGSMSTKAWNNLEWLAGLIPHTDKHYK
jgi:hypothetical protein